MLDLKGLNGGEGGSEEGKQEDSSMHTEKPIDMNAAPRKNTIHPQPQNQQITYDSYAKDQDSLKLAVSLTRHSFSGDLKDLDEKVKSMMGRSKNMVKVSESRIDKAYVCQVCGKEGRGQIIRIHIEANHLEGISVPCNTCDQTARTRHALEQHKSKYHKNSIC